MTLSDRAQDSLLAVAAAVMATLALTAAVAWELPETSVARTPVVAAVQNAQGAVQVRAAHRLGWRSAVRGDEVHDSDSIFVSPGGAATIAFADGTVLELDEKSLVVVETRRAGAREVRLERGSVSGTAGADSLVLVTPQGTAALTPRSEARVEVNTGKVEVAVTRGQASVKTGAGAKTVTSGERAEAAGDKGVAALPTWPVTLTAPPPNERRRASANVEPLLLSFGGKVPPRARVQLARDRLFAFVIEDLPGDGGPVRVARPGVGVTWWRVVDEQGRPLSESRRFAYVEEAAPVGVSPREAEVVLAPEGASVAFAWTPLVGVTQYRFELSSSRGFEPVVASQVASGASLAWKATVAEGVWYWRVSALDGALGEGLPSQPLKFRLIKKSLPNAPELLSPEVEIAP